MCIYSRMQNAFIGERNNFLLEMHFPRSKILPFLNLVASTKESMLSTDGILARWERETLDDLQ